MREGGLDGTQKLSPQARVLLVVPIARPVHVFLSVRKEDEA